MELPRNFSPFVVTAGNSGDQDSCKECKKYPLKPKFQKTYAEIVKKKTKPKSGEKIKFPKKVAQKPPKMA